VPPHAAAAFAREVALLARIHHTNIVPVLDVGEVDGLTFAVREDVPGPTLADSLELARHARIPLQEPDALQATMRAAEAALALLEALASEPGAAELVMRCLDAHRIRWTPRGELRIAAESAFTTSSAEGLHPDGAPWPDPGYGAPELVNQPANEASVVFVLGILLWELSTSERLFAGPTRDERGRKLMGNEVTPPSLVAPWLRAETEEIILRALDPDPSRRFASIRELVDALTREALGQPRRGTDRDLEAWLHAVAAPVLEGALAHRESLRVVPLEATSATAAATLAWDDEESETQVLPKAVRPVGVVTAEFPLKHESAAAESTGGDGGLAPALPAPAPVPDAPSIPAPAPVPAAPSTPAAATRRRATGTPMPGAAPPKAAPPTEGGIPAWAWGLAAVLVAAFAAFVFATTRTRPATLIVEAGEPLGQVTVELDGRVLHQGALPATLSGIEPGPHRLVISADGRTPLSREVKLDSGERERVAASLEKIAAMLLDVTSEPPGAEVFVDGQSRGTAPVRIADLRPGTRLAVEARLQGFEPELRQVEVTEPTTTLTLTLRAAAPRVTLKVEPVATWKLSTPGAEDRIGPTTIGALQLDGVGPWVVEFSAPGRKTRRVEIPDRNVVPPELAVVLEADPAAGRPATEETATAQAPQASARVPSRPAPSRRTETASPARPAATPPPPTQRVGTPPPARPAATPPPPTRPAATTPPTRPAATPPPAASNAPGLLTVQSRPAARVIIDGQDTGRFTPLINVPVVPGRHRITLVNPEFNLNKEYVIEIESGKPRTLIHRE
jgi:serine/threonine-protein kinase